MMMYTTNERCVCTHTLMAYLMPRDDDDDASVTFCAIICGGGLACCSLS